MNSLISNKTGNTVQNKLVEVLRSLGITDFSKAQSTTNVLFDLKQSTVTNLTAAPLEFFNNSLYTVTQNFRNRFGLMSAMVIQRITFYAYNQSSFAGNPLNSFLDDEATYFSVVIGNKEVLQNVPFDGANMQSENSQSLTGISIDLNTLLVLPPDTDFKVIVKNPKLDGVGSDVVNYSCMVSGYGIQLNSKF